MEEHLVGLLETIPILILSSAFAAQNCYQSGTRSRFGIHPGDAKNGYRYHMTFLARLRFTAPRCIATLPTAARYSAQHVWGIAQQSLATAVQDEFLCQN